MKEKDQEIETEILKVSFINLHEVCSSLISVASCFQLKNTYHKSHDLT